MQLYIYMYMYVARIHTNLFTLVHINMCTLCLRAKAVYVCIYIEMHMYIYGKAFTKSGLFLVEHLGGTRTWHPIISDKKKPSHTASGWSKKKLPGAPKKSSLTNPWSPIRLTLHRDPYHDLRYMPYLSHIGPSGHAWTLVFGWPSFLLSLSSVCKLLWLNPKPQTLNP